jgi:tetratricopeptide (TPR) repeat protein
LDLAITDCSKAIELDPNLAKFYANRALAYILLGNLTDARNDVETRLQLYNSDADIDATLMEFKEAADLIRKSRQ